MAYDTTVRSFILLSVYREKSLYDFLSVILFTDNIHVLSLIDAACIVYGTVSM